MVKDINKKNTATSRFGRDSRGATAVEFGLVALPFVATLFALIETGLLIFAGQVLETATGDAARLIRTGQTQQANQTKAEFREIVCDRAGGLFDCDSLQIEVQTFSTFDEVEFSEPTAGGGGLREDLPYSPGGAGEIVIVRAYYQWPVFVRLLGHDLTNTSNGKHLLVATTAFRNEPFPW